MAMEPGRPISSFPGFLELWDSETRLVVFFDMRPVVQN
jgi:hypothetical protein